MRVTTEIFRTLFPHPLEAEFSREALKKRNIYSQNCLISSISERFKQVKFGLLKFVELRICNPDPIPKQKIPTISDEDYNLFHSSLFTFHSSLFPLRLMPHRLHLHHSRIGIHQNLLGNFLSLLTRCFRNYWAFNSISINNLIGLSSSLFFSSNNLFSFFRTISRFSCNSQWSHSHR